MATYTPPDTGATTGAGLTGTAGTFQHYDGSGNGEYITDENMCAQIGAQGADDLLQALASQTTSANKLQGYSGDDQAILLDYSSSRAASTIPVSNSSGDLTTWISGANTAIFGDGSDGDAVISTSPSLSRTTHYRNLTITGTGTLKTAGYIFTVSGTLTIQSGGSINDDGNNASGITGGAALTARGVLQSDSGAGGNGSSSLGGGAGGGAPTANCHNNTSTYTGGAGGGDGTSGGGAGGAPTVRTGTGGSFRMLPAAYIGRTVNAGGSFAAGGGGGGGGAGGCTPGAGTASSGAGGGGGGSVVFTARYFDNSGTISAMGGNGSNASASGGGKAGGGGGGAGGFVSGVVGKIISTGTISAAGGTPGAGAGTGGLSGSGGTAGFTQLLELAS